jgi:hypothetical protein
MWAEERQLVHLDHLLQHPGLDLEDGLAVGLGVAPEATPGLLGVVADQAVGAVAVRRSEHHRARPDPISVAGVELEVSDRRRVAREVNRGVRTIERLGPRLVRRAEVAELRTPLDDRNVEARLLQVGRGRDASRDPAPYNDHVKSIHRSSPCSSVVEAARPRAAEAARAAPPSGANAPPRKTTYPLRRQRTWTRLPRLRLTARQSLRRGLLARFSHRGQTRSIGLRPVASPPATASSSPTPLPFPRSASASTTSTP